MFVANGTEQESESEPEAGNGRRASTSRPRRRDMAVQVIFYCFLKKCCVCISSVTVLIFSF